MFGPLTHILLDGARMGPAIAEARTRNKANDSLYRGENLGMLADVSPHLFSFSTTAPFGQWCLKKGWGASWGVMLKSAWPMAELQKHFRRFLTVKTETGRSLYFRFYDPRVLRIFLPTCDAAQIREFFGGAIDYFIVEDEDPDYALRFYQQNGALQTERFSIKEELAALPDPTPLPPPPQDPLPPEAIAALKEAGIILPGMEAESTSPEATTAPATEVAAAPAPQKAVPVQPPVPAPIAAAPPAAAPPSPATPAPSPSPKPKTKWNTFE